VENLAPTGIRSPDRPARSESQYRRAVRNLHISRRGEILCIMKIDTKQTYVATVKAFHRRISHYHGVDVIYVTNINNTQIVWPSVKFCSCNAAQVTGRADTRTC